MSYTIILYEDSGAEVWMKGEIRSYEHLGREFISGSTTPSPNLQDRKINSYILQAANMTLIPLVWTDHIQARMTPKDLR